MSRKDYKRFAETFSDSANKMQDLQDLQVLRKIVQDVANILADDNPRFNKSQFYSACGKANPEA